MSAVTATVRPWYSVRVIAQPASRPVIVHQSAPPVRVLQAFMGTPGAAGNDGDMGPPGPAGPQGATGAQGPQGVKGDTGDVGATGPSGPQGATGAQGPQGVKGDTGDVGATGPAGDPATNLVTSVNGKQGLAVLGADDVGALPAPAITGGHAVADPVAFAEIVITSSGDLGDPPIGTSRVVADNSSLQHVVVVEEDGYYYTHQVVSNAYGVEVSVATEYVDGSTYSVYSRSSSEYLTVGAVSFDDAGVPTDGSVALLGGTELVFKTVSPDGSRSLRLAAPDLSILDPEDSFAVELPAKSGTLATVADIVSLGDTCLSGVKVGNEFSTYESIHFRAYGADKLVMSGLGFDFVNPEGGAWRLYGYDPAPIADLVLVGMPRVGGRLLTENPQQLVVRHDATQPEVDCLWVSPAGQVVLITGSP